MLHLGRPNGRLFYFCRFLAFCLFTASFSNAQEPTKTLISDVVYRADGTPAGGNLLITWGRSNLSREAHNYFGIKAHGAHGWIEYPTSEVLHGTAVRVRARFARYGSMEECFTDRDLLIRKSTRYQAACACADRPEYFIRALAAHWATDPEYADKVIRLYRSNELHALDNSFLQEGSIRASGADDGITPMKNRP